ncbi:GlcG/HbpS family heme-binding protein [Rhodobium gokarnense]|uniref:Uncharacterized protein GlcG (DUF336 family) n=1 Tax=Rhodobium gokarnense TaxID=364296 RepID=A0ABT3H8H9_9HYPH|nr:heme-binding protein [Rhodobium gokarnense]MCW2306659.1 uncharacterized protein GlcG (DUF336 family) [Rhodobium gokarnense]
MNRLTAMAAAALVASGVSMPAAAQDGAGDEATVSHKSLTLETALDLAQAALAHCREAGYQVAVSVVDRGGTQQVSLRDRFAGPHTPDTSFRKAWTAVSFRTDTLELAKTTESGTSWAVRNVTMALPLGGGVMIRDGDGSLLGAVGVSGAPSGEADEGCGKAGIAAIADRIAF